jgi:hypothetical protein
LKWDNAGAIPKRQPQLRLSAHFPVLAKEGATEGIDKIGAVFFPDAQVRFEHEGLV